MPFEKATEADAMGREAVKRAIYSLAEASGGLATGNGGGSKANVSLSNARRPFATPEVSPAKHLFGRPNGGRGLSSVEAAGKSW